MKLSNECFSLQSASFWGLSLKVILTTPELYQKFLRSLTNENHKYLVALIKFGTNFQSYNLKNGALTKRIYTFTMCLHLYYVSSLLCVLPNLKKGALTKGICTFTMCLTCISSAAINFMIEEVIKTSNSVVEKAL